MIEAVLFFHPAVWYVSRRVSAERENACDDLVLLAGWPRVQYADALLQMAERSAAAQGIPSQTAAGAVLAASGGGSSQLGRRVLRLLEIGDSPRVRLSRGGVFLLATTALLVVARSPFIHAVTNKKPGLRRRTASGSASDCGAIGNAHPHFCRLAKTPRAGEIIPRRLGHATHFAQGL